MIVDSSTRHWWFSRLTGWWQWLYYLRPRKIESLWRDKSVCISRRRLTTVDRATHSTTKRSNKHVQTNNITAQNTPCLLQTDRQTTDIHTGPLRCYLFMFYTDLTTTFSHALFLTDASVWFISTHTQHTCRRITANSHTLTCSLASKFLLF